MRRERCKVPRPAGFDTVWLWSGGPDAEEEASLLLRRNFFFPEPSPKMPLIDHNMGIPDGLKLITAALFDLNKTHVVGTTPANALAVSLLLAVTVLMEWTDVSFAANKY